MGKEKKMGKESEQTIPKEDMQMAKCMKRNVGEDVKKRKT